ncbi:MAG: oligo-1,6-glucosidase [Marinoscillum sp.]|jgi:oligo-1,6-glucosidase
MSKTKSTWWKEAIVYQIYPRSFCDSNGDGIGDIPGIISKLDHIASLGVDVIWLCPVYQSPNNDNGYDISNYYDVMPEFGTMEDFDLLLSEIHGRGMKLIMDLVVNHTSDEHAWFQESRSSKDNPKRDYYIWKEGKSDELPNNWTSIFGGSTWEYNQETDDYYLHIFTKKQPDLNWENPKVREEVFQLMTFWLEKGIDGFRMDVISVISKKNYDDSPFEDLNDTITKVFADGPRIHEYLKEMNQKVLSKYDIMTVGEGPGINLGNANDYVSKEAHQLDMIFHFDHMFIDHGPEGKFTPVPYKLSRFKEIFREWDEALKESSWGSIFLGNHDFPRIVSRFGNDGQFRIKSAKLLCMLLLTHRGTPYVYQGEEIGMTNVAFDSIDDYDDVEIHNVYKEWKAKKRDLNVLMKAIHEQGRDNARTPMHWEDTANAGFTSGKPWIKLNPNYSSINVANQVDDEDSILSFYKEMISLRKKYSTLTYGDYLQISDTSEEIFAYWREDKDGKFLIVLNFSDEDSVFEFHNEEGDYNLIISNVDIEPEFAGSVLIRPWQAILYQYSAR